MTDTGITYRKAKLSDVPALARLVDDSARGLSHQDYSGVQIEAAIGTVWGVDEELIRDSTFFLAEVSDADASNTRIVGCGGWSKRSKLFGASTKNEMSELLDPNTDASRIRAFFVHPDWARKGIGKKIITLCEIEARQEGFKRMELMATLPGYRLYRACGYLGDTHVECGSNADNTHLCVSMHKDLV